MICFIGVSEIEDEAQGNNSASYLGCVFDMQERSLEVCASLR